MPEKFDSKHQDNNDDGSGSGAGTAGGKIEFREFVSTGVEHRDDLLTGEDKKRLLIQHDQFNQALIKKQKATREQRKALKEGKISLNQHRQGLSNAGGNSQYKNHPVLSDKVQFSGIDRQLNTLPNENIAETNQDKRQELQYQYNLVHRPENAPRFNPKPLHG